MKSFWRRFKLSVEATDAARQVAATKQRARVGAGSAGPFGLLALYGCYCVQHDQLLEYGNLPNLLRQGA